MLFNSFEFWVYFAIVSTAYFLLPFRWRVWLLLGASYFFYGWWDVRFLSLIYISTIIDYVAGLGMAGRRLGTRRLGGLSVLSAFAGLLFLAPNWPAFQEELIARGGAEASRSLLQFFSWPGAIEATGVMLAFCIAGPLLYTQFFRLNEKIRRRAFLLTSLISNLGLLCFFKYANFFYDSAYGIADIFGMGFERTEGKILAIALPVGISFYTFQTLSYTIDIYRGKLEATENLGKFALYVSFFPQLVAGPIERAVHLLPQFDQRVHFDANRVADGIRLMMWGLFKKVVIADRCAIYVDNVYNNPEGHSGPTYLLATYLFAWQIYCDFSGYTDIARGAARILGFDLMRNFERPYLSVTIVEFWRRWHISLSTWLRDYLYIPLGGNRKGEIRTYINLMLTMLLGGLWHGAGWNFVIWGGLQGTFLILSKLTIDRRDRFHERLGTPRWLVHSVRIVVTFHLACLSWVFFRAATFHDAVTILSGMLRDWPQIMLNPSVTAYAVPLVAFLAALQCVQERRDVGKWIRESGIVIRWSIYAAVFFGIVLFGVPGGSQFIYFTF